MVKCKLPKEPLVTSWDVAQPLALRLGRHPGYPPGTFFKGGHAPLPPDRLRPAFGGDLLIPRSPQQGQLFASRPRARPCPPCSAKDPPWRDAMGYGPSPPGEARRPCREACPGNPLTAQTSKSLPQHENHEALPPDLTLRSCAIHAVNG